MKTFDVPRGTMSIFSAGQTSGIDVLCYQRTSTGGILMDFSRSSEIFLLPVDIICPNIKQPRKIFDQTELENLSKSIRENGLFQPITVRPVGRNEYEIISGERRYRASLMAGITKIPARIIEGSEEQAAVLSLTDKTQRKNLHFLEEASAIDSLIKNYSYSVDYIASILGKTTDDVSDTLGLLAFDERFRKKIIENGVTKRQVQSLLQLNDEEETEKTLDLIIEKKLNDFQAEELIEKKFSEKNSAKKQKTRMFFKDIKLFINTLDHTVETMNKSGIGANKECFENDSVIRYTVTIPKRRTG